MEETMDVKEINMITSFITDKVEIWIEADNQKLPVREYEFELVDNRIVLKAW